LREAALTDTADREKEMRRIVMTLRGDPQS
jgi:hypothetical protein